MKNLAVIIGKKCLFSEVPLKLHADLTSRSVCWPWEAELAADKGNAARTALLTFCHRPGMTHSYFGCSEVSRVQYHWLGPCAIPPSLPTSLLIGHSRSAALPLASRDAARQAMLEVRSCITRTVTLIPQGGAGGLYISRCWRTATL